MSLSQTCLHPLSRRFPPSVCFRKLFLTELIKRVSQWSNQFFATWFDLKTINVVVNTAAGSRRLRTPGRAVRCSCRGCWSGRQLRVPQELRAGRGELWWFWGKVPGSRLWWFSHCAAQRGRCEPPGERGSDLRWNHRPGDLGRGSVSGRVGFTSAGDLQWQVRASKSPLFHLCSESLHLVFKVAPRPYQDQRVSGSRQTLTEQNDQYCFLNSGFILNESALFSKVSLPTILNNL